MKLQITFLLSLFLATLTFAGCYTQLGHYATSDFDQKYHEVLAEEKTEDHVEAESEPAHIDETETSEGYYGQRKYTRRSTYAHPHREYTPYYSGTYAPYPYYLPVMPYYSHPWYYGYGYYGYARPYRYYSGYYPYTNVYRRYYGKSRYVPLSRRTYQRRDWRPENRRTRSSRSVTSPNSKSKRPTRQGNGK